MYEVDGQEVRNEARIRRCTEGSDEKGRMFKAEPGYDDTRRVRWNAPMRFRWRCQSPRGPQASPHIHRPLRKHEMEDTSCLSVRPKMSTISAIQETAAFNRFLHAVTSSEAEQGSPAGTKLAGRRFGWANSVQRKV